MIFASDGRRNKEIAIWIGKGTAALLELHRSALKKMALLNTVTACLKFVFAPILTYGHEYWIMNESVLASVQATAKGFIPKR